MNIKEYIQSITHDGIVWLAIQSWHKATTTIGQDTATKDIIELLLCIPTTVRRDAYTKTVCDAIAKLNMPLEATLKAIQKKHADLLKKNAKHGQEHDQQSALEAISKLEAQIETESNKLLPQLLFKDLTKYLKDGAAEMTKEKKDKLKTKFDVLAGDEASGYTDDDDPWQSCPKYINAEDVKEKGFSEVSLYDGGELKKFGYYSYNPTDKSHSEITNFSIDPIFHIRNGRETRFLVEINNGRRKAVLDLEKKAMVSTDIMQCEVVTEGNFIIYGSKLQWLRIASYLLQQFKECVEVKSLGWQSYGFYAMVDRFIVPTPEGGSEQVILDEWGVGPISKDNYLVPAASMAYKKLASSGDDPYENDRPMVYQACSINFAEWSTRMQRVYLEKGLMGVAYAVLTVFRDIAYNIDNNFPHLYGYGDMSSGKSKWGESIMNFFFHKREVFNLNSGTDYAFFAYMSKFQNATAMLNEFDQKVIKPEWFQSIKGVFDGESRQRGSMKNRNQTETMRVKSSLILIGQFLVTADDNSVVSRSLIEAFGQRERNKADTDAYLELKTIEAQGITGLIVEVLECRQYVKDNYKESFNATLSEWRKAYPVGGNFNQRIMQNWAHVYTALKLVSDCINMVGTDVVAFKKYCFTQASYWCNFIRSTDTLSEFWNTMAFLVDQGLIKYGWDYIIKEETSITVRENREDTKTLNFTQPTKVLYMRMNNAHKLYEQAYRSRTGSQGMTMDSLMHYSGSRSYYLGSIKSCRFERYVYTDTEGKGADAFGNTTVTVNSSKKKESINTSCQAFLYTDLNIDIERLAEDDILSNDMMDMSGNEKNKKINTLPFG